MSEGKAIYCPNCAYSHLDTRTNEMIVKHDILGSITTDFRITIRTKRGFLTIDTDHIILTHHCGFSQKLEIPNPSFKHEDTYGQPK